MIPAIKGLKQIADMVDPATLRTLKEAGALGDPRSGLALLRRLPWLLGRGPSLGVVVQSHGLALADKPAIHDARGTMTWKELDARSNMAARALADIGLGPDNRVAMLLRNGRELVELICATQKAGMAACPLNTFAKPKELDATLSATGSPILVYDTDHAEQVAECNTEGLRLFFVGRHDQALPGSASLEEVVSSQPGGSLFPFARRAGTPRVIIQTSGTTGKPKGASRDSSALGAGALAKLLEVVPYRRDDVILCPAPLFHSFGLVSLQVGLALGCTLVLPRKFDPRDSLSLIEQHRVTAVSLVPVMIRRILSLPEEVTSRYDLSSLRIVLASGSAMGQDLRSQTIKLFGEVLYDLYGSTEAGWVSIATPDDIASNPKAAGKPSTGIEVAIFSEDGRKLPPGHTGGIYVRSGFMFEGYTSGEHKEEREGYMAIGDIGRLDRDGYLYVESRSDDMVIIGGENVYPIEVEDTITSIDGVDDAAVAGIQDEEYGQVLAAFVEGSVSEDEVVERCKAELASYKVPKRIMVLEELPRTATGKVLKRSLMAGLEGAEELREAGASEGVP